MTGSSKEFDAILMITASALVENEAKEFSLCDIDEVGFPG